VFGLVRRLWQDKRGVKMLEVIILVYMIILSFFDLRERRIPIIALFAGVIATFVYIVFTVFCDNSYSESFAQILFGTIPGILLSTIAITTKRAGIADGILLILLGMLTDYRRGIQVLCFSIIIMALFSIILLVLHRIEKNSKLPYIPFITIAFLIICLYDF